MNCPYSRFDGKICILNDPDGEKELSIIATRKASVAHEYTDAEYEATADKYDAIFEEMLDIKNNVQK
jgi:hypothetical protein